MASFVRSPRVYWQRIDAVQSGIPDPPARAGKNVNDVVTLCPKACDVAILIVYVDYPIMVEYKVVKEKLPFDIDLKETFIATFNNQTTEPPLSIANVNATGARIKGLGHAGIAIVDGVNKNAAYYEYGRYKPFGEVRSIDEIANLVVGFNEMGDLDSFSFSNLMGALVKTNGGPYGFESVYIKLPNGSFDKMKSFADARKLQVENGPSGGARPYEASSNHCFTFAMEVANVAGIQTNVNSAEHLEVNVKGGNIITRNAIEALAPDFEVPARQMRVLQKMYSKLNVSKTGSVVGDFEFPGRFY